MRAPTDSARDSQLGLRVACGFFMRSAELTQHYWPGSKDKHHGDRKQRLRYFFFFLKLDLEAYTFIGQAVLWAEPFALRIHLTLDPRYLRA